MLSATSHEPANDVVDKATKNTSALDPVQYDSTKTVRNESRPHALANDVFDKTTNNTSAVDPVQYDSTKTVRNESTSHAPAVRNESTSHAPANDVIDKATKNTSALDPVQYDSTKTVRNESRPHAPANDVFDKATKNTSALDPVQYDRPPTPRASNAHFDTDSDMDDGDPDYVLDDEVHMDSDTDKDAAVKLVPASGDESDTSDIIPFQQLSSAQKKPCMGSGDSDSESDKELEYKKRITRDITHPGIYITVIQKEPLSKKGIKKNTTLQKTLHNFVFFVSNSELSFHNMFIRKSMKVNPKFKV